MTRSQTKGSSRDRSHGPKPPRRCDGKKSKSRTVELDERIEGVPRRMRDRNYYVLFLFGLWLRNALVFKWSSSCFKNRSLLMMIE